MSRAITKWKCEKCKAEFDRYVSFGHPDEDFDFRWRCDNCGYVNTCRVEAWPSFDNK